MGPENRFKTLLYIEKEGFDPLLRKAQIETDPGQKQAVLERARDSLSQAVSGNPLLARRYGAAAAEAGRLAGGK